MISARWEGIPYARNIFHRLCRCTQSKALAKSTKFTWRVRSHSVLCSIIFLSVKIWSIQPLSLLKPACSSRGWRSTASDKRFMMTFAKILLGVNHSVMPRELLHSDRAPFFGILMMIPWFQSSGIFLLSHMVLKSGCKMLSVVRASALNSSALRWSLPGALWFLRELMTAMIFSFFGGLVSTLRSSSASGLSGSSSGAGLLRTSLKCSPNLLLGLFQRWGAALVYLVWGHFCCHYIYHIST